MSNYDLRITRQEDEKRYDITLFEDNRPVLYTKRMYKDLLNGQLESKEILLKHLIAFYKENKDSIEHGDPKQPYWF